MMTLCKASLIGFSAPFRSSAVMPSAQLMKMKLAGNLRDNIVKFAVVPISYSRERLVATCVLLLKNVFSTRSIKIHFIKVIVILVCFI